MHSYSYTHSIMYIVTFSYYSHLIKLVIICAFHLQIAEELDLFLYKIQGSVLELDTCVTLGQRQSTGILR